MTYAQLTPRPYFNTRVLKDKAMQAACALSGLDPQRERQYIGISKTGLCPTIVYDRWYANGDRLAPSIEAHLRCLSGYMYEAKMLDILVRAGIVKPRPSDEFGNPQAFYTRVAAPFSTSDIPVLGHTDGETTPEHGNQLIEIKSFSPDDWRRITRADSTLGVLQNAFANYVFQVQGYLRWGKDWQGKPYERCLFVAVSRVGEDRHEPFRFWMLEIQKDKRIGDIVETRLMNVVLAIAKHARPKCECRKCRPAEPAGKVVVHVHNTFTDERLQSKIRDSVERVLQDAAARM